MICPNCGTENDPGAAFCKACRRYLEWSPRTPDTDEGDGGAAEGEDLQAEPPPLRRGRALRHRALMDEGDEPVTREERAPYLVAEPESVPPRPEPRSEIKVGVAISLSPTELVVGAGERAGAEVRVANTGAVVDQYLLTLEGAPAPWTVIEPSVLNLYPESDPEVATVSFAPPRAPTTPTGLLRYAVRATSKTDPSVSSVSEGVVRALPYYDLDAQLVPETSIGRRHVEHGFVMRNRGNARVVAPLAATDPNELLSFAFEPQSVIADAGGEASARVQVHTRRRLWLGQPQLRPFKVTAAPHDAALLETEGRMRQTVLIPGWLVKLAMVALPLLILVAVYFTSTARVPDVVGMPQAQALAVLTQHGFAPKPTSIASDTVPVQMVVSTNPGFGARKRRGTPVAVNVSAGKAPVQVPNVAALDANTATSQLLGLGLVVARVNEPNQLASGTAIATDPAANTKVPPGSGITLHVSSGPTGAAGPGGAAAAAGAAGAAGGAGGGAGGAGAPPVILVGDATFPDQGVGSAGAPQGVPVTNQGPATLTVSAVTVGGAQAGDFSVASDGCSGVPLVKGGVCSIGVVFSPTAPGLRTATLSIASNAATNPRIINLSGQAVAPRVRLPATLDFGAQKVQTPSSPDTITLTNVSSAPLAIDSADLGGDNPEDWTKTADSCSGATVAPSSSCRVTLVFQPRAQQVNVQRKALLVFTDGVNGGSQQAVILTGTSTAPAAVITPGALTFALVVLPASQDVTLSNNGTAPLQVSSVAVTATNPQHFTFTDNGCSNHTLAVGASCSVTVTWDGTSGARAVLSFVDDDPKGGAQAVNLSA